MDYEKKYKEALEKARQLCAYPTTKPFISDLQDLFPELKESEDERIRKRIIHALHGDVLEMSEIKEAVAWLEKQGEQNLANSAKTCKVEQKPNPCDGCVNRKGCINCENGELREVEQNPADKVEPKFKIKYAGSEYNVLEVKDIAGVTYYGIEDEPNHIDYVSSNDCEIVSDCSYCMNENGIPYPTKPAKFSEQNSTWSEKDEVALGDALWCCKQAASIAKDENDMGNVWFAENWIKSLKQRYTWKPSEGQMSVIEAVINNRSFQRRHLDSLYQDLKKLREE